MGDGIGSAELDIDCGFVLGAGLSSRDILQFTSGILLLDEMEDCVLYPLALGDAPPSRELGDPPPSLGLGVEESSLVKRSPRPGLDGPNPGLDGPNPGLDGRDPGLEGPPGLMEDSPPLSTVLAGRTKSRWRAGRGKLSSGARPSPPPIPRSRSSE